MAKHEEQRLAVRFQFFQCVLHQPRADPEALTIGTDGQGCEDRAAQSVAVSLLQPHSREDDVPYGPARILGKPLPQDAAVSSKRIEKCGRILGPFGSEGVIYQLPG